LKDRNVRRGFFLNNPFQNFLFRKSCSASDLLSFNKYKNEAARHAGPGFALDSLFVFSYSSKAGIGGADGFANKKL
jgi:hypothetical protein